MKRLGFTLVELVVSITIFSTVMVIVATLFVTGFRLNQEASIRQQLYADARFLLVRLDAEIRNSTIDYEEYFNRAVMNGNFGNNYGLYRRQFYHPGQDDYYGVLCNTGNVWTPGVNCVIDRESRDLNTGQNPYSGHMALVTDPDAAYKANAFCGYVDTDGNANAAALPASCDDSLSAAYPTYRQKELYLISEDGLTKTIFVKEAMEDPNVTTLNAVSMVKMSGTDDDGDAFPETFTCASAFTCTGAGNIPAETDTSWNAAETEGLDNFVPVNSNRLNVVDVAFYVAPLESPFYAFSETDPEVQHLPLVTILLTVEPNKNLVGGNAGKFRMTLQNTVSTKLLKPAPAPIKGQFDDRV